MPVGNFVIDISRFVKAAKGRLEVIPRKIALDLLRRVVLKTPVDTGRARGNWQVAINGIPATEIEVTDKSGTGTIELGRAEIEKLKIGQNLIVVNNVSYILVLEYGRDDGRPGSPQAPEGMLRVTLANYPGIVRVAVQEARTGA